MQRPPLPPLHVPPLAELCASLPAPCSCSTGPDGQKVVDQVGTEENPGESPLSASPCSAPLSCPLLGRAWECSPNQDRGPCLVAVDTDSPWARGRPALTHGLLGDLNHPLTRAQAPVLAPRTFAWVPRCARTRPAPLLLVAAAAHAGVTLCIGPWCQLRSLCCRSGLPSRAGLDNTAAAAGGLSPPPHPTPAPTVPHPTPPRAYCPQIPYQNALAATFLEGLVFFIICITGLRAILLRWVRPGRAECMRSACHHLWCHHTARHGIGSEHSMHSRWHARWPRRAI